jgi:hypothetical protein
MPIGTEFRVKFQSGNFENYNIKTTTNMYGEVFQWCDDSKAKPYIDLINATFIPIQQPVSFMEVVKSKKRCIVKHELIDDECLDTRDKEELTTFNTLSWVLFTITNNQIDVEEIILNGKWYIEESEELEDES